MSISNCSERTRAALSGLPNGLLKGLPNDSFVDASMVSSSAAASLPAATMGSGPIQGTANGSLARSKQVYRYTLVAMAAIIVFVFFEPTFNRVVQGVWQRGNFPFAWTLSLDIHALAGYVFFFALMAQCAIGYRVRSNNAAAGIHARAGRGLLFVILPVFLLATIWAIWSRAYSIPSTEAIIFRQYPTLTVIALCQILVFFTGFSLRSYLAIRRGDVLLHVDSILAAFLMTGVIVLIRFLYALFWVTRGGSPLSVMGMFIVSMLLAAGVMALIFGLAGRWRQNRRPVLALIGVTLAFALCATDYYTFLDR